MTTTLSTTPHQSPQATERTTTTTTTDLQQQNNDDNNDVNSLDTALPTTTTETATIPIPIPIPTTDTIERTATATETVTATAVSLEKIQESNWYGSIPVQLSIATSSIGVVPPRTTTTTPLLSDEVEDNEIISFAIPNNSLHDDHVTTTTFPLSPLLVQYCMVPRFSFLHISLQQSIQYLYQYTTNYNQQQQQLEGQDQEQYIQVEEPKVFDSTTSNVGLDTINSADNGNTSTNNDDNTDQVKNDIEKESIQDVTTTTTTTRTKDVGQVQKKQKQQQSIICWFEDEETGVPLRWHLFVGVIYDLLVSQKQLSQEQATATTNTKTINTKLPWKILVHFTTSNYPKHMLLPLPEPQSLPLPQRTRSTSNSTSIQQQLRYYYQHSIKQSLTIQYNTSNVALNITKESHTKLWYSILYNNYNLYRTATNYCNFNITTTTLLTQQQSRSNDSNSSTTSTSTSTTATGNLIHRIPVRIYIDSKPPLQPSVRTTTSYTLGSALAEWIPMYFESYTIENDDDNNHNTTTSTTNPPTHSSFVRPRNIHKNNNNSTIIWKICGLYKPSLTINLFDLWKYLSYPDHFLYIIIVTS